MNSVSGLASVVLLAIACGWGTVHFCKAFIKAWQTGRVTNSTSDVVTRADAPGIYWPTLLGMAILTLLCALAPLLHLAWVWGELSVSVSQ